MKNQILWNHLPGEDDIRRVELPNGIIVLTKSDFHSPSVILSGYLNCGAIHDPKEKLGLSLFTSFALMRGSIFHRYRKIYNELETAGATLGFGSSIQTTSFGGKSLVEDLPLLLKTLSEAVRWPIFPPIQLKILLSQMITGLQIRQQDTAERASLRFDEILFPDHPYGLAEEGSIESLRRIKRSDLVKFHQHFYGPTGMVIAIVGAIDHEQAVDLVNQSLGDWENPIWLPTPTIPEVTNSVFSHREHIAIPGKFQTDLIMGSYGPRRTSKEFLIASLGNNILGQFGMMGRIGEAVREKSGLAYYASTALNAWHSAGTWEITAGVNPNNIQKTIEIIQNEVGRFVSEPVSDEELADSKSNLIGLIPLSIESNAGVANAIIRMERYKLGLNYLREFPGIISEISKDQILQVSQKYLDPTKLIIISAGT
ncbi:MAG: pitrilysin family protein [Anaerolineaceae bacterium]|jgi:zinc protease|nr:pitrilysin family protein [Anaerolineaceae bacterium]